MKLICVYSDTCDHPTCNHRLPHEEIRDSAGEGCYKSGICLNMNSDEVYCVPYVKDMFSRHYISVKDNRYGDVYVEVDKRIAIYIKQLENAIKHPEQSKLKSLYPERF